MKISICELDKQVNEGRSIPAHIAMKRIANYIIENIDKTFPMEKFKDWYDSDSEKNFRWNRRTYTWQ